VKDVAYKIRTGLSGSRSQGAVSTTEGLTGDKSPIIPSRMLYLMCHATVMLALTLRLDIKDKPISAPKFDLVRLLVVVGLLLLGAGVGLPFQHEGDGSCLDKNELPQ
jgi:hypothetical protein